jgi:hypothetical protein
LPDGDQGLTGNPGPAQTAPKSLKTIVLLHMDGCGLLGVLLIKGIRATGKSHKGIFKGLFLGRIPKGILRGLPDEILDQRYDPGSELIRSVFAHRYSLMVIARRDRLMGIPLQKQKYRKT